MRVEYGSAEKDGSPDLDADWLAGGWVALLRKWLADAESAGVAEPNAMVVGTVDGRGRPVTRTVLCKSVDDTGITFFTNYDSAKGEEIAQKVPKDAAWTTGPRKQPIEAERCADAGQFLFCVQLGQVIVTAAAADAADCGQIVEQSFHDGAGVIVEAAGDCNVQLYPLGRNAGRAHGGPQFGEAVDPFEAALAVAYE